MSKAMQHSASPPKVDMSSLLVRKIMHVDVMPDGYDKRRFADIVSGFVELSRNVKQTYEANESIIVRAGLEREDLLHEIHLLPAANASAGNGYYRKLRNVELTRRRAKLENDLIKPLYQFLQQEPALIGKLTQVRNNLDAAVQKVENYAYTYRIQDEAES